jgi:hypothetical protein
MRDKIDAERWVGKGKKEERVMRMVSGVNLGKRHLQQVSGTLAVRRGISRANA